MDEKSNIISGIGKVECLFCKATASQPIFIARGIFDPKGIPLDHESWCQFLIAVESSKATASAWVSKHGYPIRYWLDDKLIPVIHPTGSDGKSWGISNA